MQADFNSKLPKCPECGRTFQPGREKCMWCGADLNAVEAPAMEATCPICGEAMEERKMDQWPFYPCTKCRGMWIPTHTLDRIEKYYSKPSTNKEPAVSEAGDSDGAAESEALSRPLKSGPSLPDYRTVQADPGADQPYRRCPHCGEQMSRRNYRRISRVVVDVCLGHGTWFDPEELDRVIEFLKTGGLKASEAARSSAESGGGEAGMEMRALANALTSSLRMFRF